MENILDTMYRYISYIEEINNMIYCKEGGR